MQYETRVQGTYAIIRLSGDVDLESSPKVRDLLLDSLEECAGVFVEMPDISYIDSSGVASLIEALQRSRKLHKAFGLVETSHAVNRVFELARLDKVFPIFTTLELAISSDSR